MDDLIPISFLNDFIFCPVSIYLCYIRGIGTKKNGQKAFECFKKATEQGDAQAQFCLGFCYENGIGCEEDKTEAVKWYRKSAEQGIETAQEYLERLS